MHYLIILLIIGYLTFQVYESSNFLTAIIVFAYTIFFSSILFYFLHVKESKNIFVVIFSIGAGYLWVVITSLIVDDVIFTIGAFGGVTLGIIISLVYHFIKKREYHQ